MGYRRVSRIALVVLTGVLLACGADQAVSPTQPVLGGLTASLTGEKGKPQTGTWNVEVAGDVTSQGVSESNPTKLNDTGVVALGVRLDLSFFENVISSGEACFGGFDGVGALAIKLEKKNDPTKAVASYFFGALGNDGVTVITYDLQVFGSILGAWLPPGTDTTTINLERWEMKFDTRGGRRKACTDSGSFVSSISVTGLNG